MTITERVSLFVADHLNEYEGVRADILRKELDDIFDGISDAERAGILGKVMVYTVSIAFPGCLPEEHYFLDSTAAVRSAAVDAIDGCADGAHEEGDADTFMECADLTEAVQGVDDKYIADGLTVWLPGTNFVFTAKPVSVIEALANNGFTYP